MEDLRNTLEQAERVVMQTDTGPLSSSYLETVDSIQHLIEALSVHQKGNSSLDQAQTILQLAMCRLEDEFKSLLEAHSESVDPEWLFDPLANPSFGSISEDTASVYAGLDDTVEVEEKPATARSFSSFKLQIPMLPPKVVPKLTSIALRMISSGYKVECCLLYCQIRMLTLEESLFRLGVEKFSIEDVQRMPWESLHMEIVKWMKALKVLVGVLLPSEKDLCEQVYAELPAISEWCFAKVGKGPMMQLLNFAEAVAIGRRLPEKLPRILDMYEELRDHLDEIDVIFSGSECRSLRLEAAEVLGRLGNSASGTFTEFANAVKRHIARNPVPGGAVHPITQYVMNYLRLLPCFSNTLNQIFESALTTGGSSKHLGASSDNNVRVRQDESTLSIQVITLMKHLGDNVEEKAKLYKDPCLSSLFLMNNYQYIVQKVKVSELRTLVSDDWLRQHMSKVRQCHSGYLRAGWTRVLGCLRDEGGSSFSSGVSRAVLKERFKSFNAAFEETVKIQQNWIVSDLQLCADLRISIIEMLLPAYRAFLGRARNHLDSERHPERYLKYTPDQLESILDDLFHGVTSMHTRRSSFGTA